MSGRRNPQKKEKIEIEIVDKKRPTNVGRAKKQRPKNGKHVPSMSDQAAMNVVRPKSGAPMLRELSPSLSAQNTLAHMMSLLNPWDVKYNGAKVPNPAPVDSAVFKTHEIITAGTPGDGGQDGWTPQQVFAGFGGFVMRPNALGRQYAYTPGAQYMGVNVTGQTNGPSLICWCPPGGENWLLLNMIGQEAGASIPMPNTDTTVAGWLSPYAMADITNLCSKYRVVSAGLVARYIGPPITGSGMIAAGTIPYTQLESLVADPYVGSTPGPYLGIQWDSFINLKDVVTGPAMKGINMVYVPKDDRACEWKQTVLSFPLPINGDLPGMSVATARGIRYARRRGTLKQLVAAAAKRAGVSAELKEDGTIKTKASATFTKTVDSTGKTVRKTAKLDTPTPQTVGVVAEPNLFMIPWFHGEEDPNDLEAILPQPEDTESGLAALFAQATFAAYNLQNPPVMDAPLADDINNLLNIYADSNWSEAEDLMVIMWNGIAPADAILAAGATGVWGGNLFEIDKYVNYEAILDLNALDIGQMPASPGSFGSPSAAPAIVNQVHPTTALVGKPKKPESWLDKAGDWLAGAKDKVEPWLNAGSKALQVATTIADVIGAVL